jgi:hypothetical protein
LKKESPADVRSLTTRQARKMARMRKTIGKSTGRPVGSYSDQPRCACGEMTLKRAVTRGHICPKKRKKGKP